MQMVICATGEAIGNNVNLLDKALPNRPAATKPHLSLETSNSERDLTTNEMDGMDKHGF